MTDHELLDAVRQAAAEMITARATRQAQKHRAEAIRAADAARVPREDIAAAAGLKWPMNRQRWSQLKHD